MTEETNPRVLIYDVSLIRFPEFQEDSSALGKEIVIRHQAAQDRLIDVVFKQAFGIDMTEETNAECNSVTAGDEILISYKGQVFIAIGEMVEEQVNVKDDRRLKIYLEYRTM